MNARNQTSNSSRKNKLQQAIIFIITRERDRITQHPNTIKTLTNRDCRFLGNSVYILFILGHSFFRYYQKLFVCEQYPHWLKQQELNFHWSKQCELKLDDLVQDQHECLVGIDEENLS